MRLQSVALAPLVLLSLLNITTNIHAMSAAPKSLKLIYADAAFWRGECIRMAFFMGGIEFEDIRGFDHIKTLREQGKLTFGAVPVLEVDGKILSQTQAMACYASRLAGMHPEDPWLQAKIDECISGCTDVTTTIGSTFSLEDKIEVRKGLIDPTGEKPGRLWMHMNGLEKICAENGSEKGFSVGNTLTVADLAIWRTVGWFDSGTLDGIPENWASDTFPALAKLCGGVNADPKVPEWKAKYPKFYDKSRKRGIDE